MRKKFPFGLSTALVGLLCSLASCEKEQISTLQDSPDSAMAISKAPYARQVEYTHKHLATLGKALVLLQEDERIRRIMYAEFDACESGLENVLIKTLVEKAAQQGIDLEAEMNLALAKIGAEQTAADDLAAFKNIDGVDWQPQIYIPNYAHLKNAGKAGLNNAKPATAFFTYAGEEKITTYQAFKVNDARTAIVNAFMATEDKAVGNEIMIIGLSEKVRINANTVSNKDSYATNQAVGERGPQPKSGSTSTTNKVAGVPVTAEIGMMSVKTHRETWAAGASEVACTGGVVWRTPGGTNPYGSSKAPDAARVGPNGQLADYDGTGGYAIADWTRSEVDNQAWKTVNFHVVDYWNPYWYPSPGYHNSVDRLGDTAALIIYEADAWPCQMRTEDWYLYTGPYSSPVYVGVQYRSTDNPYHDEIVTTDPTKTPNNAYGQWGAYSAHLDPKNTFFNYLGHYPITTEIQHWYRD